MVLREGCRYVGQARKYNPEFREQAARLLIETGRPVAHVAAEIGVGERVLGRWVRLQRQAAAAGDSGARSSGCVRCWRCRAPGFTNGAIAAAVARVRRSGGGPRWTPRSRRLMRLLTGCTGQHGCWRICALTANGCCVRRWRHRCAAGLGRDELAYVCAGHHGGRLDAPLPRDLVNARNDRHLFMATSKTRRVCAYLSAARLTEVEAPMDLSQGPRAVCSLGRMAGTCAG
jgi:transposase-like protein